jgi:single-strand DNA-binding protein
MMNRTLLIGTVSRDPETRYTPGGQAITTFNLETTEEWERGGERKKFTTRHRIVVFGKHAETAQRLISKGAVLYLEGRIQYRTQEGGGGQKHRDAEIAAISFRLISDRIISSDATGAGEQKRDYEASDADIPF